MLKALILTSFLLSLVPAAQGGALIVSGASGAGKTTLCRRLVQRHPEKFKLSVSKTTRLPRPGEVHEVDYRFVSREEFEADLGRSAFLEFAQVHGNYYGTSSDIIGSAEKEGKLAVLNIDVNGAASVRSSLPGGTHSVFLVPPSLEVLEKRLRDRKTDSEEVIQKRLKNASAEMARSPEFTQVIVNGDLDTAYAEFEKAALAEWEKAQSAPVDEIQRLSKTNPEGSGP